MTWRPLGSVVMGPTTDMVTFGRIGAELENRRLFLRLRTTTPANPMGLAFAIVRPIADADGGGMTDGRYYPSSDPTVIDLGPGVANEFEGVVRMRCRRYNSRWLETGYPSSTWRVEADAWVPVGEVLPWFNPTGFVRGTQVMQPSPLTVGPGGAAALVNV